MVRADLCARRQRHVTVAALQAGTTIRARVKDLQGLDVLFLFGSRARGDFHAALDWDFAYLGAAHVDVEGLLAAQTRV